MIFFKISKSKQTRTPGKLGTSAGICPSLCLLLQRQKFIIYICTSHVAILSLFLQHLRRLLFFFPRTGRNKGEFRTQLISKVFVDKTVKLMLQHNLLNIRMPWISTCPYLTCPPLPSQNAYEVSKTETTEKTRDEHFLSLINWSFLTGLQSSRAAQEQLLF